MLRLFSHSLQHAPILPLLPWDIIRGLTSLSSLSAIQTHELRYFNANRQLSYAGDVSIRMTSFHMHSRILYFVVILEKKIVFSPQLHDQLLIESALLIFSLLLFAGP